MDNGTNSPAIETRNLTRIYSNSEEIRALDNVNIKICRGELVSIMGPSGSGKSTLLNMIGALDLPTSGHIFVDGQDISKLRNKDRFRAKSVGFIFQLHNLIPTLSALENVEIPTIGFLSPKKRRKRAQELLEMVGLEDRMEHLPSQLSGGQRQRVAVARSLANNPAIVLADEPTGNLDTAGGMDLMDLLKEINQVQDTTFVVVTHDLNIARQTQRVLVMSDGKIIREDLIGTPIEEDLKIWKHSGLGQRILNFDISLLSKINISEPQIKTIQAVLNDLTS